jgi:hypothetical protein
MKIYYFALLTIIFIISGCYYTFGGNLTHEATYQNIEFQSRNTCKIQTHKRPLGQFCDPEPAERKNLN